MRKQDYKRGPKERTRINNHLLKAYKTVVNYTNLASEQTGAKLPKYEELGSEEHCIQIMSKAYQEITLILQSEQSSLMENEESLCNELNTIRVYTEELQDRLEELEEYSGALDQLLTGGQDQILQKHNKDRNGDFRQSRQQKIRILSQNCYQNDIVKRYKDSKDAELADMNEIENLTNLIKNEESRSEHITQQREALSHQRSAFSRLETLVNEIKHLKTKKWQTQTELKKLIENSEEFEEYQQYTQEQKQYLKTDFEKLVKKNENNFNKYKELSLIQQSLGQEVTQLDLKMEELRHENQIMNMSGESLKQLQDGLDEQEKINTLLQAKLRELRVKTKKMSSLSEAGGRKDNFGGSEGFNYIKNPEKGLGVRVASPASSKRFGGGVETIKADFEKKGLDFELDNSFKLDVMVQGKQTTPHSQMARLRAPESDSYGFKGVTPKEAKPKNMSNILTQSDFGVNLSFKTQTIADQDGLKKQIIQDYQQKIEELESKVDLLGRELIQETQLQEQIVRSSESSLGRRSSSTSQNHLRNQQGYFGGFGAENLSSRLMETASPILEQSSDERGPSQTSDSYVSAKTERVTMDGDFSKIRIAGLVRASQHPDATEYDGDGDESSRFTQEGVSEGVDSDRGSGRIYVQILNSSNKENVGGDENHQVISIVDHHNQQNGHILPKEMFGKRSDEDEIGASFFRPSSENDQEEGSEIDEEALEHGFGFEPRVSSAVMIEDSDQVMGSNMFFERQQVNQDGHLDRGEPNDRVNGGICERLGFKFGSGALELNDALVGTLIDNVEISASKLKSLQC